MPYPLPLTRTEAYLAYKAGVIQQSDLKPSLAVPRNGIDAWLAYWTGLAADYPKRGDGTPHILKEEEAYIAYLCGVINEYPEKCLRRVGAYLRYLISARWGRPDHPTNLEELYLSLIKTQVIPSGDPSSDIVIDGTAKASFQDVKMYGDTFQQTYTGKNLANTYGMSITAGGTGITLIKDSDGSIVLNGTSTDLYNNIRVNATGILTPYIGQNITVSVSASGTGSFGNFGVKSVNENLIVCTPTSKTTTKTLESRDSYVVDLYFSRGFTFSNYKLKLQVEVGSTATSYEPYVGGTASPSPEYPQPIRTVTGLQTVEVSGKNLFDGIFELGNINPTTGANTSSTTTIRTKNYAVIKGGENYTISVVGGGTVAVGFYQSNGTFIGVGTSGASPNTFTAPANAGRVRFIIANNTNISTKAQCEKGSSATDWTPYSKHAYEINLGKNLYDKNTAPVLNAYFSAGVTTITGNNLNRLFYIPCEPNTTYTFQKVSSVRFNVAYTHEKPALGVQAYGIIVAGSATTATITTDSDAKYLICRYYQSDQETIPQATVENSIQVEVGNTATSYAPYFTPIELCKIGTYQDYIWKDGDSWKVHKAIAKATLDGSENWGTSGTNTFYIANIYSKIGNSIQSTSTGEMYASHFTIVDITSSNTLVGASLKVDAEHNVSNLRIRLQDMSGGTAGFRQMLSAKKPSIYARRLTPTDTTITDTNLIAQLEALVAGGAENGTTYIKVNATDPNLPGLLYVEAPKYE